VHGPRYLRGVLDKRLLRDDPDQIRRAVELKGIDVDVDEVLSLDERTRDLQTQLDRTQARRNDLSKRFAKASDDERATLRAESTEAGETIKDLRERLAQTSDALRDLMLLLPQMPWEGAPVGPDEDANTVVRTWGEPRRFDFTPLDHVDLIERRGWGYFARARQVAGERAYTLMGDLALLERAIHSYAIDVLVSHEFTPITVPALVKESALTGTGMFPKGRGETYEIAADDLFLAGTSEVGMIGLHAGEILEKSQLPVRYAGISPCFRREIGSASRDVRGLLRVHQFEKVEQFVICEADDAQSARWHDTLLDTAESILRALDLPYEVVECSTGDMGAGKYRMNDVNTWFPSLERYRETHSCSTFHEWQARRADIRYRDEGRIVHAHTLNNTAVATPRLLAAVIENHQQADGSVTVPEPLRPFLGGRASL